MIVHMDAHWWLRDEQPVLFRLNDTISLRFGDELTVHVTDAQLNALAESITKFRNEEAAARITAAETATAEAERRVPYSDLPETIAESETP